MRYLMLGAALLTACATPAGFEKRISRLVGKSVDQIVVAAGPPQSTYELSDGRKVLQYELSRMFQVGGYQYTAPQTTYHQATAYSGNRTVNAYGTSTTYVNRTTPVYNIHQQCTVRLVARNNVIESYAYEGNHCMATDPG